MEIKRMDLRAGVSGPSALAESMLAMTTWLKGKT